MSKIFFVLIFVVMVFLYVVYGQFDVLVDFGGMWFVIVVEQCGCFFDVICGGMLMIVGGKFELMMVVGNKFSGMVCVDVEVFFKELDFVYDENEFVWYVIYQVDEDVFCLNYVDVVNGDLWFEFFVMLVDSVGMFIVMSCKMLQICLFDCF